jgi:hypothetical protein
MSFSVRANIFPALALLAGSLSAQTATPRVVLLNPATLAQLKAHPDSQIVAAARAEADHALKVGPLTVTAKARVPPSGDKHDYMSMARYFWPNPATPNHLPYIRKDGETNPEIREIGDLDALDLMGRATRELALAYFLTGDDRYAEHAAMLLHTWFLAPATAMNPNLNFAQYIPGVNTGRGAGILDARRLTLAIDAAGLIAGSKYWTPADQTGLQKWFSAYYAWLTTSDAAKKENAAPNNHGSWFQMQAASIAGFLGKTDDLRKIAERVRDQRIPSQIDAAGMQKYEMVRTNSFSYSAFNLEALTQLATVVAPTGIDLYQTAKPGAPGILTALDALLPYDSTHPWPHEQISSGREDSLCPALVRAAAHTGAPKYLEAQKRFDCKQTAVTRIEMLEAHAAAH